MTHQVCLFRRAGRVPTPPPSALLSEALTAADVADADMAEDDMAGDDMADELFAALEVRKLSFLYCYY